MQIRVDQDLGRNETTVRENTLQDSQQLGILILGKKEGTYVFSGISEPGCIITLTDRTLIEEFTMRFGSRQGATYTIVADSYHNFGEMITHMLLVSPTKDGSVVVLDTDDPELYQNQFLEAIRFQREQIGRIRVQRADIRNQLISDLYPDPPSPQ